ncbi:MAG TPA: hypothetical protein VJC11_01295 [Patescibacteria group bacterium]|nr:hypothetical protein [Patescibacteria group bacterium]
MSKVKSQKSKVYDQRGVALLPVILVLFGLVAVVGIAIAAVSVSEGLISVTKDASDEAFVIAESGVQDALMKLARDKDFTSGGGYTLSVSGGTATITVTGSVPGTKTITSTGTLNSKSRRIQAAVTVDANGKITFGLNWWQEIAP